MSKSPVNRYWPVSRGSENANAGLVVATAAPLTVNGPAFCDTSSHLQRSSTDPPNASSTSDVASHGAITPTIAPSRGIPIETITATKANMENLNICINASIVLPVSEYSRDFIRISGLNAIHFPHRAAIQKFLQLCYRQFVQR